MSRVIWSPKAKNDYADFLDSVAVYSVDSALALDVKVEKLVRQLQSFKLSYPPSPFKKDYRRCVVSKHLSLTYRVRKDTVYIVAVGDNRSGQQ